MSSWDRELDMSVVVIIRKKVNVINRGLNLGLGSLTLQTKHGIILNF